MTFEILIIAAIFLVAVLYSSVGHGGASGYLAVMALFAVAPEVTKPTALILNVFVATIAFVKFYRAGHFDWKIFAPFALTSVPLAFLGGSVSLPAAVYKIILGVSLLAAAVRLILDFGEHRQASAPKMWVCLLIGAILGLVSGMVGIGGGIFLTPILLLTNWTETKKAAGISALFILVNSVAGLLGSWSKIAAVPPHVWLWVAVAVGGGLIGAGLGSAKFNALTLRRVLAVGLIIAAVKLIFG